MAATAETWAAGGEGERRGARLASAFAVSIACHALVLLAVRGWRMESRPAPPLVVTMIERGGGEAGAGGDAAAAGPPAPAVVRAPSAPAVSDARPAPPPRALERRTVAARPPSRPRADAITRVPDDERPAPALAAADAAESGAERAAGAPSAVGAEQLASLGHGAGEGRGDAGVGSGDGRGGAGVGSGAGGGSDGLRAFCARCPAPVYPGRARRQGWQGTVDVELVIGRGGAVEAARIGRSSGYPTLDDVALAVARESRFTVPTDGAGLRGELRYRFVLDATAAER